MTHSQKIINEIIKVSGKTQKELAETAGFHKQQVQDWKSGNRKPSFEAVISLCQKNNLKISDIMLVL